MEASGHSKTSWLLPNCIRYHFWKDLFSYSNENTYFTCHFTACTGCSDSNELISTQILFLCTFLDLICHRATCFSRNLGTTSCGRVTMQMQRWDTCLILILRMDLTESSHWSKCKACLDGFPKQVSLSTENRHGSLSWCCGIWGLGCVTILALWQTSLWTPVVTFVWCSVFCEWTSHGFKQYLS